MKIAHVIWARFPVQGYGGTERVCYWLAKAQAERGHELTILCREGSRLPFARTIAIPDQVENIEEYLPEGIDIVQLYNAPNFRIDHPYLVNIGGNGQAGEKFPTNTVFVSRNHAERHGWTEFVHNGIDLSEYPIQRQKKEYAIFLAKASWRVKNLKGSIRIAKAANIPLHVAGGRAACWHRNVFSHGTVDGAQKLALLQNARVMLFPVIWEEPFGLAVVEALATGTPVVCTPRGALPEIITPDCGVVADSFAALVEGVQRASSFSPEACRARVEQAFTHHKMAEKYESYYSIILRQGKLRDGQPETPLGRDPQQKILYKGY